jgi:6-phosphogluconolactonase
MRVYVGCYTDAGRQGIWVSELEADKGVLSPPVLAAQADNVSSIALHPSGRWLYAVNEISEFQGRATGSVSAFEIGPGGVLRLLNQIASEGAGPCWVALDRTARWALVANYGGGTAAALGIAKDGSLRPAASVVRHPKGADGGEPHAHAAHAAPDNRSVVVPDLGLDTLFVYPFDATTGVLDAVSGRSIRLPAGSGPSNFHFHPVRRVGYALMETANRVATVSLGRQAQVLATADTLPAGFARKTWSGDVVPHPNGRFLYTSNCGHDSIARFRLREDGAPDLIGHTPSAGETPRGFTLDPAGRYLLAANLKSGSVVLFRCDADTGDLHATGSRIEIRSPVCVRIV